MKIFRNEKVYVQKSDIMYLTRSDSPILGSIFTKSFTDGVFNVNDSNRYEFVEFDEKEEIKFFKDIDWIINYDEVKDLSEDEFIKLVEDIKKQRDEIADTFNSMFCEDKHKNLDMIEKCEMLDYKIYSLRDILWFKQGYLYMELPKEKTNRCVKKEESGFQKIFKMISNRMKKTN